MTPTSASSLTAPSCSTTATAWTSRQPPASPLPCPRPPRRRPEALQQRRPPQVPRPRLATEAAEEVTAAVGVGTEAAAAVTAAILEAPRPLRLFRRRPHCPVVAAPQEDNWARRTLLHLVSRLPPQQGHQTRRPLAPRPLDLDLDLDLDRRARDPTHRRRLPHLPPDHLSQDRLRRPPRPRLPRPSACWCWEQCASWLCLSKS